MFVISILFKSGTSQAQAIQELGLIASDYISLTSHTYNIKNALKQEKIENFEDLINDTFNIKTVLKHEYIESLEVLTEYLSIRQIILEYINFKDDYSLKIYDLIIDYLFKLSYSQIISIALEDFLVARFLPDYHVIEYLAKESQLDRYSVSKVLVALSNLLRDCQNYDVRQVNAISLRIHKAIMNNNKTVFVITEF
jgi:hypothetical protein